MIVKKDSQRPRVLEIGHAVRTAYCGYLLAALGAHVTKVVVRQSYPAPMATTHRADQRAAAYFFDHKKTVRSRDDSGDLASNLGDIDVVVAGSGADIEEFLGLSCDAIRARHSACVLAIASMFGESGEYRDLLGGEAEALALSGLMSMIGEPGREPLRLGGPQTEQAAALSLFTGIMVALYKRCETGRGTEVLTSAVRSTAYLDWKSHIYFAGEGKVLQRGSNNGPVVLACSDGFVGFYYRDEEWPAVKKLVADDRLDDAKFDTQLGRDRHRSELVEILESFSRDLTREQLYRRSQDLRIPAGPVLTLAELGGDRQLQARRFLRDEQVDGLGVVTVPSVPWTVDGVRGSA